MADPRRAPNRRIPRGKPPEAWGLRSTRALSLINIAEWLEASLVDADEPLARRHHERR